MGKYEPLGNYLRAQKFERIPMSFAEIERILKIKLPPSKMHRAWWSNNPSNNVMTKQWLAAGYKTVDVNPEGGEIVFQRGVGPAAPRQTTDFWERMKGLKGMVTILDPDIFIKPIFEESDYDVDSYGRTRIPNQNK